MPLHLPSFIPLLLAFPPSPAWWIAFSFFRFFFSFEMSLWAVLKFLSINMKTLKIKTHQIKNVYTENHFFILSKGLNAGKPLERPCANCFVLFAKSEEEKNQFYWLCFGLWQGDFFRPFLTGSVISFIRLDDLKTVINEALSKVNASEFDKSISVMQDLEKYHLNISKQLELIRQAKKSLMYKMLR
jgi:hypothetical protein